MYLDAISGAAGDMVLGALIDAGLPQDALRAALGSLGVGHELRVTRVLRSGLSATHVEVVALEDHEHTHTHDSAHHSAHSDHQITTSPHHHIHRSLRDIAELIGHSALSGDGKARAIAMFRRLAEAEAAIHDMPVEQVHLHEVGAVDSIIDIVGAAFAFEWFGIDDVVASPLNVGGGTVQMAHGAFPVPAPATLRLLAGAPVYSHGADGELVTPTGALVISTYARSYGPMPAMRLDRTGYGAGTRDTPGRPNVLRVMMGERGERPATDDSPTDVIKIECEIDDMTPQLFGPVGDQLLAAGALDVFLTPIYMKKGRPGTLLTVLGRPDDRERLSALIFRQTTSIGLRIERVERETLDRRWEDVTVEGGRVRIKVASRRGEVVNAAPEFDDCVRVAAATGRPIKIVQAEALRAWSGQGRS
jgi:uncharacterized protein (TIGR00299 family) protein